MINPMGYTNDGQFELIFLKDLAGFGPMTKLFDGTQKGGIQVYDDTLQIYRTNKLKLINKSTVVDKTTKQESVSSQNINIDGEDLSFKKSVIYEMMHQELEVIADVQQLLDEWYRTKPGSQPTSKKLSKEVIKAQIQ